MLNNKNVQEIRIKYHFYYRNDRYEEPKKQYNRFFSEEKLVMKVIMDCRITSAHKFRTILGLKQYNVHLTEEQPVLTKIMSSFKGENMQTEYMVLGYRVDLYFQDYKLSIEIDENRHSERCTDFKVKKTKSNRARNWLSVY